MYFVTASLMTENVADRTKRLALKTMNKNNNYLEHC